MSDEKEKVARKLSLKGEIHHWKIGDNKGRRFFVNTLPLKEVQGFLGASIFNALRGTGEQRQLRQSHVKELEREMVEDHYTPTVFSANMVATHFDNFKEHQDGTYSLTVFDTDPLHCTDGNHRLNGLLDLLENYEEYKTTVAELPITLITYIDGDPKEDFINLQAGQAIDKSHLTALRVKTGDFSEKMNPIMKLAFKTANLLDKKGGGSHLEQKIQMDSRVAKGAALIPLSVLMPEGASQDATTLTGGAKIAQQYEKDAKWLADIYVKTWKVLEDDCPQAVESGKLLCPFPAGGKGSSSLIVGLGNIVAFRTGWSDRTEPSEKDMDRLAEIVKHSFNLDVPDGGIAANVKRTFMYEFTKRYCQDLTIGDHGKIATLDGIPKPLVKLWSASTFGISKEKVKEDAEAAKLAEKEASTPQDAVVVEQPKRRGRPSSRNTTTPATPPTQTGKGRTGKILVTSGR